MSWLSLFRRGRTEAGEVGEQPVVGFEVGIGGEVDVLGTAFGVDAGERGRRAGASADDCWHPAGAEAIVAGRRLDGLVYVGRGLVPADARSYWLDVEPSLIDPTLSVGAAAKRSDPEGVWPLAYDRLAPSQRAFYLDWLAGGRARRVGAGYVELFVAGLERRALADAGDHGAAVRDRGPITREVERLLGLYPDQRLVYRVRSLWEILRVGSLEEQASELDPPVARAGWEAPLELRVGLGALAKSGRPLPVEWALSWARCSPQAWLRTPAQRCPDEFRDLFALRYRERYGGGFRLKDLKQRVTVEHRPINDGLRGPLRYTADLPEVVAAGHLVNPLRSLARACTDELDAYSRYLGRQPEARGDPRALALLPPDLLKSGMPEQLDQLRELVAPLASQERMLCPADPLIALFAVGDEELVKKDAVALARLLAAFGAGIEPDVRFGGDVPAAGQQVILFRLSADAAAAPTPEYAAAAALLQLAAAVAAADDSVSSEEERVLGAHLGHARNLEEHERARLAAHLDWLLVRPPSLGGINARVAQIRGVQREAVAAALLGIAGADGVITAGEVRVLTRIFAAMGLDEALLYGELDAIAAAPPDGPITVRAGQRGDPEYALPAPPAGGNVVLNRELIEAKLVETAAVSTLLAGIFVADEPPAPPPQPTGRLGLEPAQYEFLRRLAERTRWSRAEIESLAGELRLLPDGVLELVNEAGFASAGAPVWQGEDPIEIDVDVLQELLP